MAPLSAEGAGASSRAHLEEATRFLLEALDSVVAFGHVQSRIRAGGDAASVFPAARAQLRRLVPFSALGFMTVGDGSELAFADSDPPGEHAWLEAEVESAIGRGLFAAAVAGDRVVTLRAERGGHTLVLRALVSGARVVGMFAGLVADGEGDLSQSVTSLLSLILLVTAQAFEGATLYARAQGVAHDLERGVEERTRELRAAYEELSRTRDQLVQAQKIEAVGRLAGGIAHDFNNLLVVISGHVELLKKSVAPGDPRRRHAEVLADTADRAAALTRQLLAFSRKQVLEPRELDPGDVIRRMELILRRLLGEHIELITACDPGVGRVRADPSQLEQVVLNLAVNARDAMPGGGRLVLRAANVDLGDAFVLAHPGAPPGPAVVIEVTDTGAGMSDDVRAHLFEPFFTTKPAGQGTGLGLATVYGIVRQSEGHIAVDSAPGRGTRVSVYLPRVAGGAAAAVPAEVLAPPRGAGVVLVVEDEEPVRAMVAEMLELSGYTVLSAAHGAEAIEIVKGHAGPLDLVVTDVVMPYMGGRQLAACLAKLRPGVPILFMSGYPDDALDQRRLAAPGSAFIQKPFAIAALGQAVKDLLDAQPAAAAPVSAP